MRLEDQIRSAFTSFAATLPRTSPYSRERELVSRFVLSHLLPTVQAGRPLFDPGQIGIEVAVPQRRDRPNPRRDPDVCKDVVLWAQPGQVCWDDAGRAVNYPAAVIEWKSINRKDPTSSASRKRESERPADVEWLRWLVETATTAEGYSVLVDLRSHPTSISVTRLTAAGEVPDWIAESPAL